MLRIVHIEANEELTNLLGPSLKMELKAEYITCSSNQELAKILREENHVDLLICREKKEQDIFDVEISRILQKFEIAPKGIVFTSKERPLLKNFSPFSPDSYDIHNLISIIKEKADPEKKYSIQNVPNFIPFSIHYFFNLSKFESDIYIKLKEREEEQFVKRINANEELDKVSLLKYQKSGLDELYIPKEYRFKFIEEVTKQTLNSIKKSLAETDLLSPTESLKIGEETFELTGEMLESIGVTKETVKLSDAAIDHMRSSLKNSKTLSPLLKSLFQNPFSYRYKRCYLITLFGLEVLKRLDWFSRNQIKENFEKLSFASFLHDIVIKDEELLRIHSKIDLYRAKLDEKRKDLVLNHANLVSSIIQKYPGAPTNVDIIIKQHHGTTNGIGFAENLNAGLAKLSIVFIVVEKFVMRLLDFNKEEDSIKNILEELNHEFSLPSYQKVMECIKDTILKI